MEAMQGHHLATPRPGRGCPRREGAADRGRRQVRGAIHAESLRVEILEYSRHHAFRAAAAKVTRADGWSRSTERKTGGNELADNTTSKFLR